MADYSWPNVSMLEGCGELPLHPPSVAGKFYLGRGCPLWVQVV